MTHEYTTVERAPLDIDRINRLLDEAGVVSALRYSRVTSSTQTEARTHLDAGARPPIVFLTDEQTLGRGRLDRNWTAPAGSAVLMTVVMDRPPELSTLPLLVGVAVARVLQDSGADVRLKWPNDIVFVGSGGLQKVGGIIAELHGDAVLIGIGINADMAASELPTAQATSLSLQGAQADRERIVAGILSRLRGLLLLSLDEYRQLCDTIGCEVRVHLVNGEVVLGHAEGVDDDGALRVVTAEASVRVTSGDVFQLRGIVAP